MEERIVITGMGTVNPLGHCVKDSWENVIKGKSGVGPITLFDASDYLVQIAAEVKDFSLEKYLPAKEARRRDRFGLFATVASQEAIRQSGIDLASINPERVAVVVSSAIGGIKTFQDSVFILKDEGPRRLNPFSIPMLMSNGAASMISIDNGFTGPCFSVASACASGADAIGIGWMMLRFGLIDICIAGASEATITPIGVGSFDRLGAMARRTAQDFLSKLAPDAPRPFDKDRDGLVMGEGAAILILEREDHARRRKAQILAELAGYASTADAYHITAPAEDGKSGATAMKLAMDSAKVSPGEVGYINAHGTATILNDLAETRAIKTAFGSQAYKIPVSSTKSMTGHMMGATAALEVIFCVNVVHEHIIPPTINYQTPDPDCDLDYVPNQARQNGVRVAISNAFGFGGHNAVLVIREYNYEKS